MAYKPQKRELFLLKTFGLALIRILSIVRLHDDTRNGHKMTTQNWIPCTPLTVGDTLKWNEPIWAPPNKPRGKRDKIGEQEITAKLINHSDLLELEVISVEKVSSDDAPISVQENDRIKRKQSSLEKGNCLTLS